MKKIALITILLCLGSDTLLAQYQDETACTQSEIKWLTNDKKYLDINSQDFSKILINTKTIKIDRKNKTIDVEFVSLKTKKEKSIFMKFGAELYQNHGFDRTHTRFNYEKRTRKSFTFELSNCNGDIIRKNDYSDLKEDALPASSPDTSTMNAIVEIYNLK